MPTKEKRRKFDFPPEGFRTPIPPLEQHEYLLEHFLPAGSPRPNEFISLNLPDQAEGWLLIPKPIKYTEGFEASYLVAMDRMFGVLGITHGFGVFEYSEEKPKLIANIALNDNVVNVLEIVCGRTTEPCITIGYRFGRAGEILRKKEFFLGPYELATFLATHLDTSGSITSKLILCGGADVWAQREHLYFSDLPLCFWWDRKKNRLELFQVSEIDLETLAFSIIGIIP